MQDGPSVHFPTIKIERSIFGSLDHLIRGMDRQPVFGDVQVASEFPGSRESRIIGPGFLGNSRCGNVFGFLKFSILSPDKPRDLADRERLMGPFVRITSHKKRIS